MKDRYYLDPRVAERYENESSGQQGDIEFYASLAREAAAVGQPVLELACGTGRVSIPVAREGVKVLGLDQSPAMLDIARQRAAGIENIRLVEGDMADFDLGERFGLVFIPFRSFLMLMTVAEQKSCLRAVRRHLVDGGRLALNFFNPSPVIMARWMTSKRGSLEEVSVRDRPSFKMWSTRQYLPASQSIEETRIEEELDDRSAVISRVYRDLRLRYVFRYEMEHLLALTGFEIEALYGWFDMRPFTDDSSEMVWVARKA